MNKWTKIRKWINKNDGEHFQVDNQTLNKYEIIGYLLLIFSFIVYLFNDKVGFQAAWLGWLFLIIGVITLLIGISIKLINEENT